MRFRTVNTIRARPIRKMGNVHVSGIKRKWKREHSSVTSGNGPGRQADLVLEIMTEEAVQNLDSETRQALADMEPSLQKAILSRAQGRTLKRFDLAILTEEAEALHERKSAARLGKDHALRNYAVEQARRSSENERQSTRNDGRGNPDFRDSDSGMPATDYTAGSAQSREHAWESGGSGRMGGNATGWNDQHGDHSGASKGNRSDRSGQLSRFQHALTEQIREGIRYEINKRLSMQAARREYQKGEYQKAQEEAARDLRGTLTGMGRYGKRIGAAAIRQLSSAVRALKGGSIVKAGILAIPVMIMMVLMNLIMAVVSFTPTMDEEEPSYGATASEIVSYALEWVGVTKYIYGAGREYETDWQDYADCSSFVHGVFSHFGIDTGSDTCDMEADGLLIANSSLDEALPGDMILFYAGRITSGNSYHVGLYIGGGQMVHCTGSRNCVSPETAGPGVLVRDVYGGSYQVRRIVQETASGGTPTGGHRIDATRYTQEQMEIIWAVVAQEDNGSYEGALAVISCAMNRTEAPGWQTLGSTAMQQLTAPGQFCYTLDNYWLPRLGGNVPSYVKQAVTDCLQKGIRNHSFTSFRSTKGKTTGNDAVQIGVNWFFGH